MRILFAGAMALALMCGAAAADTDVGPAIYTQQPGGDSDLKAKGHRNKLKAPDASLIKFRTRLSQHIQGVRWKGKVRRLGTASVPGAPAFGTFGIPYTSGRVQEGASSAPGVTDDNRLSTTWPYSPIGKMTFLTPEGNSYCSASLIGRSILVTAAHCYQDFGSGNVVFTNFVFRPGHYGAVGATNNQIQPYGSWRVATVARAAKWANGTDIGSGSARDNDIAVFILRKLNGEFAGDVVGSLGIGYNNYSFVSNAKTGNLSVAAVSTLGYPALQDRGRIMQRADGPSYLTLVSNADQIRQGNNFTGGSSGGPWVVNFGGADPVLTGGATIGSEAIMAVVGVTSWGSDDPNLIKDNFSSQFGQNSAYPLADYGGFGAGNIGSLLETACNRNAPEGGTFADNGYCD